MRQDEHLPELDGVRGIACLSVVVFHVLILPLSPEFLGIDQEIWKPLYYVAAAGANSGVDLFFVLSGFLIGGILIDKKHASNMLAAFWIRRIARIFPVYFLLILSYVLAIRVRPYLAAPWLDDWLLRNPLPLWSYFFFLQNYVMAIRADPGAFWVGITWSLAVEEQFYVVAPLLVLVLPRRAIVAVALAGVVVAPIARVWLWNAGGSFYSGYFPTPAKVDALLLRLLAAVALRSATALEWMKLRRRSLDLAAAAVGLLTLLCMSQAATSLIGRTLGFSGVLVLFAFAILRVSIVPDGPYRALLRNRALLFVGLISYPLYMYHQAINGLVHGLLFSQAPMIATGQQLAASGLVLVASTALAAVSTRHFEQPFRSRARRVAYRL